MAGHMSRRKCVAKTQHQPPFIYARKGHGAGRRACCTLHPSPAQQKFFPRLQKSLAETAPTCYGAGVMGKGNTPAKRPNGCGPDAAKETQR